MTTQLVMKKLIQATMMVLKFTIWTSHAWSANACLCSLLHFAFKITCL